MHLNKKNLFDFLAINIFIGMAVLAMGVAYSAEAEDAAVEKEELDVNLNSIFISVRPHAKANVHGDIILQYPFALTKGAEETGLGPIAAILYVDRKFLISNVTQRSTVSGYGRMYYVYSAYETQHTLVPYVTLYRESSLVYYDVVNKSYESKTKAWLPPGLMYAYRKDDKTVLHFDAELFSYSQPANNILRAGGSYRVAEKWIASASYERLAWDFTDSANANISAKGSSNSISVKFINSNPFRNNFAFILGYAVDRNTPGSALRQTAVNRGNGLFGGLEVTLGTLAW